MHKILQAIIAQKQKEVAVLKNTPHLINELNIKPRSSSKSFKQSIIEGPLSFIAEIKRQSPAKGLLPSDFDRDSLLQAYIEGGASAISILTDEKFFKGSLDDLKSIAATLKESSTPILRKDFIIDPIQINQSIKAGADAVLLIVSVLKEKTEDFLIHAKKMGIDAIVEVHDRSELDLAITIGADMIGINNRHLSTFKEDINTCLALAPAIPDGIVKIAESSIKTHDHIGQITAAGFDGVLIGERLVTAKNPAHTLQKMREAI